MGEFGHFLVEYRELIAAEVQDAEVQDILPGIVYFPAAIVLDESMADRAAAVVLLERIQARYRGDDLPKRLSVTVFSSEIL